MLKIFKFAHKFCRPINFVMIDQCQVEDEELAQIIQAVQLDELILDLFLIRMTLEPVTIAAIINMQKKEK